MEIWTVSYNLYFDSNVTEGKNLKEKIEFMYPFLEKQIPLALRTGDGAGTISWSVVLLLLCQLCKIWMSSPVSHIVDFFGDHRSVCCCGVSPGCHGTVCIIQVEFHQTTLAVCNIGCCCLYQFCNHYGPESCKCLQFSKG